MKRSVQIFMSFGVGFIAVSGSASSAIAQPLDRPDDRSAASNAGKSRGSEPETQEGGVSETSPDLSDGLWPSRTLLRLALTRFVDDACDRYDMDERQRDTVRVDMVDRWETYLGEHRSELQPLLNDFLEMRLGLDPPDEEEVKSWADRAMIAFEQLEDRVEESWDQFRDVLTPMQRVSFEIDVLRARAGLGVAAGKLKRWRDGSFEVSEIWAPRHSRARLEPQSQFSERRADREEPRATLGESAKRNQVELELDRWDQYVANFIAQYRLDEGQRSTALSLLAELKQRANDHHDRYREDIKQIERRIERADRGDDDERRSLKSELVRVYGPIDELFAELERRLEPIPTQRQREIAAQSESRRSDQSNDPQPNETPPFPVAPPRSDAKASGVE